jgi:multiple sugar transport system substrate-binding protein
MSEESKKRLSRRKFVALTGGALAASGLLAACGDNTATTAPATTAPAPAATTAASTTAAATTAAGTTAAATTAAGTTAAGTTAAGTTAAATTAASTTAAGTTAAATTAATGSTADFVTSKSGYKGSLDYWALGYAPGGGNVFSKSSDTAVAAFMKANPDIKVTITGYTPDNAGFAKIVNAVQSGSGVDVFRIPNDSLPTMIQSGAIAPIDDYLTAEDKADILPNLFNLVTVKGKLYAWPLWVPPVAMYMNLDIFKEKGVDMPPKNWTYDQFVDVAKKLTFTRGNDKVYGYSALIDPGLVDTWPFILSDGALPLSSDNTKYTWNTPDAYSGLKKIVDLVQVHKVTPPDFGTQKQDDVLAAFKNKLQAMLSRPSGDSGTLIQAGVNLDIWPMPMGKSGKPVSAGGVGLIAVTPNKDTAKQKAAMDLARYLTSPQVEKDVPGYYLAPAARKSVTVVSPYNKFAPMAESAWITPSLPAWTQIRTLIHPNLQNAVFGKLTPEQALSQPADEINKLLAQK